MKLFGHKIHTSQPCQRAVWADQKESSSQSIQAGFIKLRDWAGQPGGRPVTLASVWWLAPACRQGLGGRNPLTVVLLIFIDDLTKVAIIIWPTTQPSAAPAIIALIADKNFRVEELYFLLQAFILKGMCTNQFKFRNKVAKTPSREGLHINEIFNQK